MSRDLFALNLLAALLALACSRQPSSGVATLAPSASSPKTAAKAAPALCSAAGDDLQPVQLDVDAKFLSERSAHDVLDPVWWSADIYGSLGDYERCLAPFSREQRLMFALLWYQSEVDNGGHDQFFFNSTGIVYPDALSGLRDLHLSEGVEILTEAGRRMGGAPARDRNGRQRQLDKLKPEFDDLDTRFYAFDKKANLDAAMTAYVRAHADGFIFHGVVHVPRSSVGLLKR